MIYYESGAMAREQKLETLKEIERKLILLEINKKKQLDYEEYKNKLKQKANEIGEELIGCGKDFDIDLFDEDGIPYDIEHRECGNLFGFCPTCKEIKERVARINNE